MESSYDVFLFSRIEFLSEARINSPYETLAFASKACKYRLSTAMLHEKDRMKRSVIGLVCVCLLLNGCGNSRLQSTGTGAAVGAGAGLAAGFLCCKDVKDAAPGMFIGMAVGALIGFLIAPSN